MQVRGVTVALSLAICAIGSCGAASIPSVSLAQFKEHMRDDVPSGMDFIAGVERTPIEAKAPALSPVLVVPQALRKEFAAGVCVRARSRNGRYIGQGVLGGDALSNAGAATRIDWSAKYASDLRQLGHLDLGIVALAGSCDLQLNEEPAYLVVDRNANYPNRARDVRLILNTGRLRTDVQYQGVDGKPRKIDCEPTPDDKLRTAFDTYCDLTEQAGGELRVTIVTYVYERPQPPLKIRVLQE